MENLVYYFLIKAGYNIMKKNISNYVFVPYSHLHTFGMKLIDIVQAKTVV